MQALLATLAHLSAGIVVLVLWTTLTLPLPFMICCGATLLLAALSPRAAVGAVLAVLPLFGNRAGTPQALAICSLSCHLLMGLALRSKEWQPQRGAIYTLGSAYMVVSVLSLSGMPIDRWLRSWQGKLPFYSDIEGWSYLVLSVLRSSENSIQYPLLSVFLTLWAFELGRIISMLVGRRPEWALRYGCLLLFSLISTCAVGILDYYGIWSIRSYRSLDPVVNPGGQQFRMQSFFGHSGWFAEYVTLAIPFVLVLLVMKRAFVLRVIGVLAVLLLGEFVLILSFQRGGWLSYPLTLLVVWAAIYITRKIERGEQRIVQALRSSLVKILISLPITVVLSILLLAAFQPSTMRGVNEPVAERYWERFKDIGNTSDRSEFFMAGLLLGTLNPFLGNGSESFAYHFRREFIEPGGAFFGRYSLPLHGSAHNVYMQTFSGKGLAGLCLLVALIGSIVWKGFRLALTEQGASQDQRVLRLALACFGGAFLIYGNVQEVFYIQSLQLLCFSVWGLAVALLPGSHRGERAVWSGVVLAVVLHLGWLWLHPRAAVSDTFGCYAPAPRARWCGREARQNFPVHTEGSRHFVSLRVFSPRWEEMYGEPPELKVLYQGRELHRLQLRRGAVVETRIPVPESAEITLDLKANGYLIRGRGTPDRTQYPLVAYRLLPVASEAESPRPPLPFEGGEVTLSDLDSE